MEEYGYSYKSYSNYNTAGGRRIEEPFASLIKKPFGPFVPDSSNHNSESYVPRRKQIPVTTGSYANDYRQRSPTKAYPARDDDYEWHRPTSPVHGRPESLTRIQNEASRPAGFSAATTDWRQRPHPTAYNNGANGYGDHGGSKEGHNHKPIVRSDSYDNYHCDDGYGGNGHKPMGNDIYDDKHDNSYGKEHGTEPRVFPKPKWPTDGYDNFDPYKGNGGNNYSNKEGRKPIVRNDSYDGYNRDDGSYGGKYGNKEGHKPMGNPIRNDSYDRHPPAGKPTADGGWTGPIWTAPPKQGTQLTSPTSDINMAIELLKEAANISGSPKAKASGYPNNRYDSFRGMDRPTKESEWEKPIATANSGYKQSEPSKNVGKPMEPPNVSAKTRTTIPVEYDKRDATRRYDAGTIDSKRAAIKYDGRLL